jgi:hypothetical protein
MYHGARKAKLIKPMTPFGFKDSHGNPGQCWELKFEGLPETVYRWLYPALDLPNVCETTNQSDQK